MHHLLQRVITKITNTSVSNLLISLNMLDFDLTKGVVIKNWRCVRLSNFGYHARL